ncbi:MAG TPA: hypothetical protein PLX96_05840, partial [Candidatus Omnitrophota bacterium]|nr:hypothetical protein [Candidatus Omnitrophota bacterium]
RGLQRRACVEGPGDAARFTALLEEYQKSKEVTWNRLQIETLEKIYPLATKVIVDPQAGANVLPLLPLGNSSAADLLQGRSDPTLLSRRKEVLS